jgi:superfamily I DNA/RNA helicase
LLDSEVWDVDGNTEERKGTISVFDGAPPIVEVAKTTDAEHATVETWLRNRIAEGLRPEEIAIFVRSEKGSAAGAETHSSRKLDSKLLGEDMQTEAGRISVGILHAAKGLEFRAVAAVACDGDVIPSQERIEALADEADLEKVYNTAVVRLLPLANGRGPTHSGTEL